jgi:hypothetical protein
MRWSESKGKAIFKPVIAKGINFSKMLKKMESIVGN